MSSVFSNGTEYMVFEDRFCSGCVHYKTDEQTETTGCPVTDMTFLADALSIDIDPFIDRFIQWDKTGCHIIGCHMRIEKPFHDRSQLQLFEDNN